MITKGYLLKFRELREKNEGQVEMYDLKDQLAYKAMMSILKRFDEYIDSESINMALLVKDMQSFSLLTSHLQSFCMNTDFGKEVIELNYEFLKYLKSLGYDFHV